MKKSLLLYGLVVLMVTSCAPVALWVAYDVGKDSVKANVDDIFILEGEPGVPYIVLGSIEVETTRRGADDPKIKKDLNSKLQKEAGNVGGEAVINVKYEEFDGGTKAMGDVVVFK